MEINLDRIDREIKVLKSHMGEPHSLEHDREMARLADLELQKAILVGKSTPREFANFWENFIRSGL